MYQPTGKLTTVNFQFVHPQLTGTVHEYLEMMSIPDRESDARQAL